MLKPDKYAQTNSTCVYAPLDNKVHKITYLEPSLKGNWDHSHKIRYRLEKARVAFMKIIFCGLKKSVSAII